MSTPRMAPCGRPPNGGGPGARRLSRRNGPWRLRHDQQKNTSPPTVKANGAAWRHPGTDRNGAPARRFGGQQRIVYAVLAYRPAHPYASAVRPARWVWRGRPADAGRTLGAGLRQQFHGKESAAHGAVRRRFPGRINCRDTVTTIELVSFRQASSAQRFPAAGLLRPNILP